MKLIKIELLIVRVAVILLLGTTCTDLYAVGSVGMMGSSWTRGRGATQAGTIGAYHRFGQGGAVGSDMTKFRAPRPDAQSYPGSSPQVVSPFDSALLAEIKKCVCQLKGLVESGFDTLCSKSDLIISLIEDISIDLSLLPVIDSKVDLIISLVDDFSGDDISLLPVIDSKIDLILSLVDDFSGDDISLLPVIDSKVDDVLFNIGSRTDLGYSQTDQLSTVDQINALDLTVIALLKTILMDLHGL